MAWDAKVPFREEHNSWKTKIKFDEYVEVKEVKDRNLIKLVKQVMFEADF
jgi:hypothetical protein